MFEKTSKFHPDKVADRIAGAVVYITGIFLMLL